MKEKNDSLLDNRGILSDEAIKKFISLGKSTSCECPEHLAKLLLEVKKFSEYQKTCLKQTPHDEHIHNWLYSTSINLEHFVSSTIINLARMEGHLDENNQLIDE